ncbi:hypothetical protein DYB38_010543 [Aphanomyces astaci]|uniref:Uncharacterized protein n=1 Tax=Aphanomyces astaci TaxID=112090 RepID=A0A397CVE3_APHAT|nr:hypothetical protein DYB38_010543 [Aphanomyces astaci]
MDKTTTLGLPPLPGVDSERDAKAVIRRMRMQGCQPDSSTLDVQSFNQLIVAAKDDVVADDAAAKDELTYYRNLLDKVALFHDGMRKISIAFRTSRDDLLLLVPQHCPQFT